MLEKLFFETLTKPTATLTDEQAENKSVENKKNRASVIEAIFFIPVRVKIFYIVIFRIINLKRAQCDKVLYRGCVLLTRRR